MHATGIMSNTAASSWWPSHSQTRETAANAPHSKGSIQHGWGAWTLPVLVHRRFTILGSLWEEVGTSQGHCAPLGPAVPGAHLLAEDMERTPTWHVLGSDAFSIYRVCRGQGPTDKARALVPCYHLERWQESNRFSLLQGWFSQLGGGAAGGLPGIGNIHSAGTARCK